MKPRSYQTRALDELRENGWTGLVRLDTGYGKSLTAAWAAREAGAESVLVVAPKRTQLGWTKTFDMLGVELKVASKANKKEKANLEDLFNGAPGYYWITWELARSMNVELRFDGRKRANVRKAVSKPFNGRTFDMLVTDECFTGERLVDTPQGPRRIDVLQEGDEVLGYDHETNEVITTVVRATMQKKSRVLSAGVTANHPYFVVNYGYTAIADITKEDYLVKLSKDRKGVSHVRGQVPYIRDDREEILQPGVRVCKQKEDVPQTKLQEMQEGVSGSKDEAATSVLREALCGKICGDAPSRLRGFEEVGANRRGQTKDAREHGCAVGKGGLCRGCIGENEKGQSLSRPREHCQGIAYQERARDNLRESNWGQREDFSYGAATLGGVGGTLEPGPRRDHGSVSAGRGMPQSLQTGPSVTSDSPSGGSGRRNTQQPSSAGKGRAQGQESHADGLDSLAIQELRDRARVEQVCAEHIGDREEVVYNIETGSSNYFVDGLLVHNCQRMSNHRSQNREVISRVKAKAKIALSATPAGNQPVRIWATLNLLWPDKYPAFGRFSEKHFNWEPNPFADYVIPGTDKVIQGKTWGSERRPGYLRATAPCWIEATEEEQAEIAQEEPVRHVIPVRMGAEQKRIYMEWYEDALAWLDEHPVAAALPITKEIRLRQAALGTPTVDDTGSVVYAPDSRSSKIEALLDLLSDLPEDEPVIVWTHSQRFMVPLLAQLRKAGYSAIEVSGKSKDSYTELINGTAQILCAVPEAMAEGTDGLQSVCATEVWLSLSTSVIINKQARGRIARQGQKRLVNSYLIQSVGTIDDRVVGRLDERFNTLKESGFID